ncbi:hypothetical protein, partial [Klebsiella pneumoniae]
HQDRGDASAMTAAAARPAAGPTACRQSRLVADPRGAGYKAIFFETFFNRSPIMTTIADRMTRGVRSLKASDSMMFAAQA